MIKQFILFTILVVIFFLITSYFFQRRMIYFPLPDKPSRQLFHAEDMQAVELTTADSVKLNAWYKPAINNKPTLLYLHGNAGHIGYRIYLARQFISAGYGILLLEYRGYGGNKGHPSEKGLYQDGRAAIHFLNQQGVNQKQLVLYGESLGSGVATQLATEFRVCAMVLQSPFTSLTDLARYHYPFLPIPLRDKFDSLKKIKKINTPVLILHGKQDKIVPYKQAYALFNHANEPKQWVEFPNKGHNDLWDVSFANIIMQFVNEHC